MASWLEVSKILKHGDWLCVRGDKDSDDCSGGRKGVAHMQRGVDVLQV